MVCFAGMIVAWLIKTGRCYSSRVDLIFRSLFLFISFTTPSGRHRQKEKSSVDHALISYQITAIKQIPLHLPVWNGFRFVMNLSAVQHKRFRMKSHSNVNTRDVTSNTKSHRSLNGDGSVRGCRDTCVTANCSPKACEWVNLLRESRAFFKWSLNLGVPH